jgi:hypothetical protein
MGQHLRRDFVARMSGAISGAIAYADAVVPDVAHPGYRLETI